MKNGIKQIIEQRIAWPPNLPRFLDLAGGLDTDAAFDRFIRREPPADEIERLTRGDCGYACRSQLSEDKARARFKSVYLKWHGRSQRGELPDREQKALPKMSTTKTTDHMVEERIRSNKPKTELELRLEAIANKAR